MSQYIHVPFAVGLLIALAWTTIFSLTSRPGIRGFRNLGILASYVLVLVFLFVAGWRAALLTWAVFGVAGGVIYTLWEILERLGTAAGEEKPGVSLSPLVHGLFAWPIMVPEAAEYALAKLGILRAPPPLRRVQNGRSPGGGSLIAGVRRAKSFPMDASRVPSDCPVCHSPRVASILYGLPDFTPELERALDEKRVVLGRCGVFDDEPEWQCIDCDHRWGTFELPDGPDTGAA